MVGRADAHQHQAFARRGIGGAFDELALRRQHLRHPLGLLHDSVVHVIGMRSTLGGGLHGCFRCHFCLRQGIGPQTNTQRRRWNSEESTTAPALRGHAKNSGIPAAKKEVSLIPFVHACTSVVPGVELLFAPVRGNTIPVRVVPQEGSCPTTFPCTRSEEHTSELQSLAYLVCRLLLEKKKNPINVQSACT